MTEYVAHVKKADDSEGWAESHELSEHLLATARLAENFAQCVGSDWAELSGRWHDLGKYRKRFQGYIRIQSGYEVAPLAGGMPPPLARHLC